jgi:acid phosphatase
LTNSTKLWKIIVLHQPGWCAGGSHGNDGTVQSTIQPLCVDHGVSIVLAGHNHYYSRAVNNGVHHVTSGAGGAPFYSASSGQPYVVTYTTNTLECVKIAIAGNTLTGTAVSNSGAVIDTFTITK